MKWFFIISVVMISVTLNIEGDANILSVWQALVKRGFMAWFEFILLTIVIVAPSFFSTKLIERFTVSFYPGLKKWKSLFIAIFFTMLYYLIIMSILEPIKHA